MLVLNLVRSLYWLAILIITTLGFAVDFFVGVLTFIGLYTALMTAADLTENWLVEKFDSE